MITTDLIPIDRGSINDALNAAAFAALLELHAIATEYINHLAEEAKAPSTIDRALAAIAVAHRSVATDGARAVLRTYRRDSADGGRKVRKARPLLVSNLRLTVDTLDPDKLAGLRDRSILVLGFALGARRSEIAALDIEDLDFNEHGLEVTIRRSKTDKDATGHKVHVPYGTNEQTCPVRTTRAWLAALAECGVASGALYRRIDKHGQLGRAPHGRGSADGRISGQAVAIIVQRTALAADIDAASVFSGHSLRRGFATETRRAGHDQIRIGRHGGWKDGSPTLAGYMEDIDRVTSNALTGVGL
ncbi:site-specific integrase [Micromonospora sp. NPDC005298]|uniref:site-specific integrase n=1 Tax=Micromonospora sp. NPDC005298 TaxID=3156873 RepID=UPI0033BAA0D4